MRLFNELANLRDRLSHVIGREAYKQGYESWLVETGYELRKIEK
jgi:hypothetical protein